MGHLASLCYFPYTESHFSYLPTFHLSSKALHGDIPDAAYVGNGMKYEWREISVEQAAVMWRASPVCWLGRVQALVFMAISKIQLALGVCPI